MRPRRISVAALAADPRGFAAERLHDLLIEPFSAAIEGRDLYIVPDRALNLLPFAALREPASGRLLVDRHSMAVMPRLDLGPDDAAPAWHAVSVAARPVLVGGDAFDRGAFPDLDALEAVAAEIAAVEANYREPIVLLDASATAAAVRAALFGATLLHFAGHAFVPADRPRDGTLLLTPAAGGDGVVRIEELLGGAIPPPLVVLDACRSAHASIERAGAFDGLARGFLLAGSRAVIGNLWPIIDTAASVLFTDLHQRLAAGTAPSRAVRETQQWARDHDDPSIRSPFTWAGLVTYVNAPAD